MNVKKILLTGTALVVVSSGVVSLAHATELNDGATISNSDGTGLQETTGAATVTINSNAVGGGLTLGANATPSVAVSASGAAVVLNVTTSGASNGVIFADNITTATGSVTINATNDNLVFRGNTSAGTTINAGSGSVDPTISITVDTFNAENITFAGVINAVDAADTVNLTVLNTATGARTVDFTGAIGGGSDATRIDNIQIGADTTAPLDVRFLRNVNAQGTITLGAAGANNSTNVVRFGESGQTTSYTGTVQGAAAGDTNNVIIVSGSTTSFNSPFGANLDNITIGGAGTTATTFHGSIDEVSGAFTLSGAGGVINNVTFDATGRNGTALVVTPTITGADGAATNNITISGGTDQIVRIVNGATNIDAYTINTGTTLEFQGAAINNVSGTGGILTLNRGGAQGVTADIGASGSALAALNLGGTGTKTLNNAVFATVTNIGAVTTNAAASLNGNVNFTGNGTLNFAHNAGTTGAITSTTGGDGTVRFAGAAAVDGAVGTGTHSVGTIGIDSNDNTRIVTFGGPVNAGTLSFTNTGVATLSGTSGASTIGSLNKTDAGVGTLNLTGTSLTVNGANISTGSVNINFASDTILNLASGLSLKGNITNGTAGHGTLNYTGGLNIDGNLAQLKTLTVTSALGVTGDATAANAMDVGINSVTVGGTFTTTADTNLTYRVNTPTTSGKITSTGEATVVAGTKVNMVVDTNVYVSQGQEFILIDGAESGGHVATLADGNLTTTNTALLHFKQKTTDTNNLVVYADRTQMNVAASVPNNAAVGTMLDSLGAGGDADVTALQVRLGKLNSNGEVEAMLSTVTPDISGGTVAATTSVGNSSSTIINNRVGATRSGQDFGTGVASGDWAEGGHIWGQAFGATADQGMRDRIAGYESDSYGAVAGVDAEITDNFRAGVALTYASTDVDGKDSNNSQADIDSYQVALYGDVDLGSNYFITGQLGYMYSDIETTRYNVGGAGAIARADFSSDQYTARGEVGRQFVLDNTFSLTPSALVNYNYIDVEDYTERGAGGLSLRNVDTDELQILEFGVNLVAEAQFDDTTGGKIRPNVHAGYRYDVIGDEVTTIGRLAGGGAAFKTEGFEPAQGTANVGAGLTWETNANVDFTVNYDYESKSDYDAHSGFVRAGYKF